MWKVASWLSIGAGILSMVLLAKQGFDLGFVAPLQTILEFYHRATEFLFGWAEPYLRAALTCVGNKVGWDLHLYPHRKHFFVLLSIYFGTRARFQWSNDYSSAKAVAVSVGILGVVLALASSVASGTLPLEAKTTDVTAETLSIAFPVAGIILYEFGFVVLDGTISTLVVGIPMWNFWRFTNPSTLTFFALCGMVLLLATQTERLPLTKTLPNPGLVLLSALVIAYALSKIWQGARQAFSGSWEQVWYSVAPDIPSKLGKLGRFWWLFTHPRISSRVGFLMLTTIGGAALFIALNAGLKLAGL